MSIGRGDFIDKVANVWRILEAVDFVRPCLFLASAMLEVVCCHPEMRQEANETGLTQSSKNELIRGKAALVIEYRIF